MHCGISGCLGWVGLARPMESNADGGGDRLGIPQ